MTAETEIILEEKENVVLIPTNAVSQKDGKSYVTVSSENGWNSVEVSTVSVRTFLLKLHPEYQKVTLSKYHQLIREFILNWGSNRQ
jgi:multidrug efflux pump subunit AcrA (membrane-fusion protein)